MTSTAGPHLMSPTTDGETLAAFVRVRARAIREALELHGAILFRGFAVGSEPAFEEAILSVPGLRAMRGYFLSETGRDLVEGGAQVFHTNTKYKTGGSFELGGLHSENWGSPDVPRFQSFWCKTPPPFGGETAIVHTARAYPELPARCREVLERTASLARALPLARVAARYEVSAELLERFCAAVGLRVVTRGDERLLLVEKPHVYADPQTGRHALQVHVSNALPGFDPAMRARLAPRYAGWAWALHRLSWRSPTAAYAIALPERLSRAMAGPDRLRSFGAEFPALRALSRRFGEVAHAPKPRPDDAPLPLVLAELVGASDVTAIVDACVRHLSLVAWQRDDVLLFDNAQVLHAGMPGRGRRELRVMMLSPIPMHPPFTSGVLELGADDATYQSFATRFIQFREAQR